MKKLFMGLALLCAGSLVASAQTEFRHITFDEALTAAKKENKLVFIDFFTTWCGPCKKMSKEVFPQVEVGDYMNATFIPMKLDAEAEGKDLARIYEVKAYPTYVIVNAKGEKVASFSGAMDAGKFLDKLQAQTDPEQSPARIKERYEGGERTPKVVNSYAMQLMEQRKEKEGFEVIDSYWKTLSDADRLNHDNTFLYTVYTFDLNNDRANFMKEHFNDFAEADRKAVGMQLERILNSEFNKYFSGYYWKEGKWDAAKFAALKGDLNKFGFNTDGKYDLMSQFVEKRPVVDDKAYMAFCEANYDKLGKQGKDLLMFNLTRLFNIDDQSVRQSISNFIRPRLATMSPVTIQYAGRTLDTVEK